MTGEHRENFRILGDINPKDVPVREEAAAPGEKDIQPVAAAPEAKESEAPAGRRESEPKSSPGPEAAHGGETPQMAETARASEPSHGREAPRASEAARDENRDYDQILGDIEARRPGERNIRPALPAAEGKARGASALFALVLFLLLGVAALGGYEYWFLRSHGVRLAELPAMVASVTNLEKRMNAVEAQLAGWASDREAVLDRLNKMDARLSAGLRRTREQTRSMIAQSAAHLQQELDQRTDAANVRLAQLEMNQQSEHSQLARLGEQLNSPGQSAPAAAQPGRQELSSLRQQQEQQGAELEAMKRQLARSRVSFEARKNQQEEIVPGLSLQITHTDVRYQRYSGWIWYVPDHRAIWIKNQGAERPVTFYPKNSEEAFELVVTGVEANGAAGYLISPVAGETEAQESSLLTSPGGAQGPEVRRAGRRTDDPFTR